jgi:predicted nuclease of predicted toxin-antitoxin system
LKVLLDACVWGKSREALTAAGHDVVYAGDWTEALADEEILARAFREGRVLVTLDKDFGELAVVHRQPHMGVVRLVGVQARRQGTTCVELLERFGALLVTGAIVTAEPGRIRVRATES